MKNNCGVVAYDELVGKINGRTNNISLDTLAKMAQDNGFILFPMRITHDNLSKLQFPFILHNNHHFETVEEGYIIDEKELPDPIYVLSSQCIPELVITENEARAVKGGGPLAFIPAALSGLGAAGAGALGSIGAGLGTLGSAGAGALSSIGSGVGSALSGLGAAGSGALSSVGSALGGAGSAIGGALGGAGKALGGVGSSLLGGAQQALGGIAGGGGMTPGQQGQQAWMAHAPATAQQLFGGGQQPGSPQDGGARLAGGGGNIDLSKILGAGLMGSSALPNNPQFQLPASVNQYKQQVQTGAATPLGAATNQELQRIVQAPFGQTFPDATSDPYIKAISDQYDTQLQRDIQTLKAQYATTGSPFSGELQDSIGKLTQQYAQSKQTAITGLQHDMAMKEIDTKLTSLSQASGIDQSIMSELAGLTNLDVQVAADKYNVDVANIQSLRDMLGLAGTGFTSGTFNPVAAGQGY